LQGQKQILHVTLQADYLIRKTAQIRDASKAGAVRIVCNIFG